MSLELESVQVLDLVSFTKEDVADAFGEEDGYVVETPAAQAPFEAEAPAACTPPSFAEQLKKRAAEVKAEAGQVLTQEIPF